MILYYSHIVTGSCDYFIKPDTSFSADRMQNHDFQQIGDHNAFNPRPMLDLDLNALLEFGVGSGGIIYHIAT